MQLSPFVFIGGMGLGMALALSRRRWWDAVAYLCLALYSVLGTWFSETTPWPLRYAPLALAAAIVIVDVARRYRRYKASLVPESPA